LKGGLLLKERRYDIDWLRVIAIIAVFLLHSTHFFDEGTDWHVQNKDQSVAVLIFRGLINIWVMELFFLLSGAASWFSLKSKSGGQYLLERVKRIFVPMYTVGIFVLLPPTLYFTLVTNRGFTGTFWQMYPTYLNHVISYGFNIKSPFFFGIWPGHLWFLQFLFIMSVVLLPLLLFLRSERGHRLVSWLAGVCARPGGIFLFLIPLAGARILFKHIFMGDKTWADLIYYAVFFLIGYVMASDGRFTEGFKRHGWLGLGLGLLAYGGMGYFILGAGYNYPGGEPFSLNYVIFNLVVSLGNLCWVTFMLSLGAKYLNFESRAVTYGNEAVLPFYILHEPVLLAVGWWVVPWSMGILPKFLIISVASLIIIGGLYLGPVRNLNWVRFLFGMRPKKKKG